eukprot:CAMPEP_0118861026 /NCGR_PEP_ID=MMETSP1163-20130328/6692_1 /TAXON_ID=124430 /ORGANISM="Phaeomonas parva, Strain CCMP2877" /LENGTH=161 /DNA_ID=CAMNT_0006794799 /DNA_START=75 /DNA_END=560 /DNA_ORIENTATION=-
MVNLADELKPECPGRFYDYCENGLYAGGIVGAVRVAWEASPTAATNMTALESMGSIMSRVSKTAGWVTAVVATFSATECMSESMRGADDPMNAFAGGFNAGMLVAMYTRNPAIMLSTGIVSGGFAALIDAAGENILGDNDFQYFHTDPKGLYPRPTKTEKH